MEKFLAFCIALLSAFVAQAAPAKIPNCGLDGDGDGYCVADPSTLMPGPTAGTTVPKLLGTVDCNDGDSGVYPGAVEIVNDGVDQNCDGNTGDFDRDVMTFAQNAGPGHRCNLTDFTCLNRIKTEIAFCRASPAICGVRTSKPSGFLVPKPYVFLDETCIGYRKPITEAQYLNVFLPRMRDIKRNPNWVPNPDLEGRCIGGSYTGSGGGSGGVSSGKLKALDTQLSAHDVAINTLSTRVDGIDTRLTHLDGEKGVINIILQSELQLKTDVTNLTGRVGALESGQARQGGEIKVLQDRQGVMDTAVRTAQRSADDAGNVANATASNGLMLELSVGFGSKFQGGMPLRNRRGQTLGVARDNVALAAQFGLNIGYQMPDSRWFATARINPISDEGPSGENETGIMYSVGLGNEWRFWDNANFVGGTFSYFEHESGGTVLSSNALSRGFLVGPSYTYLLDMAGPWQTAFSARVGGGYESYGSTGPGFKPTTVGGAVWMLSLEVAPGFGPLF